MIKLKVVLLFGSLWVRSGSWILNSRSENVFLMLMSLKSNIESCIKNFVSNRNALLSFSYVVLRVAGWDPVSMVWWRQLFSFLSFWISSLNSATRFWSREFSVWRRFINYVIYTLFIHYVGFGDYILISSLEIQMGISIG